MRTVEFIYNGHRIRRKVAEKWDELTRDNLLFLCKQQLRFGNEVMKLRKSLAYMFVQTRPRLFFKMNNGQLQELMMMQNFLFEECDLTKFLIKKIRLPRGILNYYSPGDCTKYSTVAEIAYADSYLQNFQKSGDDMDLCMIIASLYRSTNPVRFIGHYINGMDIRVKFNDSDQTLKRRAKRFQRLPSYLKKAILYQYIGCRTVDAKNNADLYKKHEDNVKSFGWAGVIKQLAGGDLVKFEAVEKMLWSNAVVYLLMLENERVQQEEAYDKIKNQY